MNNYFDNKISQDNYLLCPSCDGLGSQSMASSCKNCAGIGTGVHHNNYFFYWSPAFSLTRIELRRLKIKLHKLLNIFAIAFGLLGFFSLAVWVYQRSNTTVRLEDMMFWHYKHELLRIFWLSTIADLFLVYRLGEDSRKSKAVKVFKYEQENKSHNTLNSWQDLVMAGSKDKIDVSTAFSEEAYRVSEEAFLLAKRLGNSRVEPIHLFFSSLTANEVASIFARLNLSADLLVKKLKDQLKKKDKKSGRIMFSPELRQTLIDSYLEAGKNGQAKVDPKNFLTASLKYDDTLKEIMIELELNEDMIRNAVLWFVVNEKQVLAYKRYKHEARFKPSGNMDKAYTALATPILNQYGYDLTLAAKWSKLEYCVAREEEIEEIWSNMESGQNGVLLVGEDGVGKRAVMAGIAEGMVEENVPKFLIDKRLIEVDVARLVSGVSPDQAEGRMMAIIDEVVRAKNIVLFIPGIESIIGITSGSESSVDLAEVFVSAVERKKIYAFATTSNEKYFKYIEGSSLGKNLAKVEIAEPKGNQAIQIIESRIFNIEDKHGVYFTYGAIDWAVKLSDKYLHDSYLPQKAMNILEETAVKASKRDADKKVVTKDDVIEAVSRSTNIPLSKISDTEGRELLNLEDKIHERMVGQEEAVSKVSASLRRARTELREGVRPIANFLFLGPTGVGKTELAKTISSQYFGDEKYMIRMDMSEFQLQDSVKKMIGDVASGEKGRLTDLVRKSPFSLVLLDEVEKAHPDVLNLFLQVMDDGRLTDAEGHTVDFSNSIIIATSNIGAVYIQEEINRGTSIDEIKKVIVNEHLNKVMRPELINRFDGVIVFEPLSLENVVSIARIMLKNVEELLEQKGMRLEVEEEGLRKLAKLGFDPKFGARPLRRLLQEKIEDTIANKILSGELKRRDLVVVDNNGLIRIEKGKIL